MKLRKHKELIIFIVLIPVFLYLAFYISSRAENRFPQFSIENKSGSGCSIFYEALKSLKLPVERTVSSIGQQNSDCIQIVVSGGNMDINGDGIKHWVQQGGIMVILSSGNFNGIEYGTISKQNESLSVYSYGKGAVIAGDVAYITNKTLKDNRDEAYELLKEMSSYDRKKIYFNENNLFSQKESQGLWDYMPLWAKFEAYQFLLIAAAYFYYRGKRFGKAIPFCEEEERSENEYLYSVSSLYRKAKAYDLILISYYNSLIKETALKEEDLLQYWQREQLPSLQEVRKLEKLMKLKDKMKPKECAEAVALIEELKNILKQRRETHWKTLKKIQ